MNLLLFRTSEVVEDQKTALIEDPVRIKHISDVLKVQDGANLRVGIIGGKMGMGQLISLQPNEALFKLNLMQPPPPKLPMHLIVALPRPKTFRKLLWGAVTAGVASLTFVNSARTDKGYWQSPLIDPENVEKEICLALEQARDTVYPEISFYPLFRPFAEDVLPELMLGKAGYVAHPVQAIPCPYNITKEMIVAIGPEGGWVPFEIECFEKNNFEKITLGSRILRVEQAVQSIVARMNPIV